MLRKIINPGLRNSTLLIMRSFATTPSFNRFLDDDEDNVLSKKELELQDEITALEDINNKLHEKISDKDEENFRLKEQNTILQNQLNSARNVINKLQKLDGRDPNEQLKAEIEVHLREHKSIKNKM